MPSTPRRNLNIPGSKAETPGPSRSAPPLPSTSESASNISTTPAPAIPKPGKGALGGQLAEVVDADPYDSYDNVSAASWARGRDSRGRDKRHARGHRLADGVPVPADITRLIQRIGRLDTEVRDLKSRVSKLDRQAETDRCAIRDGELRREALREELRKTSAHIKQLFNENEELRERSSLVEAWAGSKEVCLLYSGQFFA